MKFRYRFLISFVLLAVFIAIHYLKRNIKIVKSCNGSEGDCIQKDELLREPRMVNPTASTISDFDKIKRMKHFDSNTKVIYFYTTFFYTKEWSFMKGPELYRHFSRCPKYTNCLATYEFGWRRKADAALFHGRDMEVYGRNRYTPEVLTSFRRTVVRHQKWIFLSHENPANNEALYKPYDGLFNWTATFDRRSDVFIPYSEYIEIEQPKENTRNFAKEKTGLVAWAASNCGLMREQYALELEKYIGITVYGRCNKHFKKQRNCPHFDEACNKELSIYKFYLAFENDFCNDYVTEKYWERILQEVVPVVMGANYDKGIVIPGSYIDVSDFGSIKELADYLLYLDKNDDEYNKYFKYKERYKFKDGDIYCNICAALHRQDARKSSQIDLTKTFNYKKNCGINQPKIDKLKKQIKQSKKH